MEITYQGGSSFTLAGSRSVAINPEGSTRADLTLYGRRQRNGKLRINGPGEYEIGGILIATVPVGPHGAERWAHAVTLDDTNVLFLEGDVDALTDSALIAIGPVDVLIVAAEKLPAALKTVQDLTPRLVVPFGPHAAELCTALGVKDLTPVNRVNVNGKGPRAALLKAPRAPGRKRSAA